MRGALVTGERVEFIYHNVADRGDLLAELRRGQQDEQRFRSGDKNMRRAAEHRGALARRRIAGAETRADAREIEARFGADFAHADERLFEVEANVVSQRL